MNKAPLDAFSSNPSDLIGRVVSDRYRIDALIDQGAMGQVYSAEHVLMRKRVAMKVLRSELTRVPEVRARFEREALAAANINHPNVAAATDFGTLPSGSVYLVLEFVEGCTLRSLIERGPLPVARALAIAEQIGLGLQAAHALEIVHRDLKPENVMLVARPDGGDLVKVLDFGVAKVPVDLGLGAEVSGEDASITQAGMIFGTPDYMAPEQALGQAVDARADVYSLGIILYEMLAGRRPFSADHEFGIIGQQLRGLVPPIAEKAPGVIVPAAVEEFVRALLVNEMNARVQTAAEAIARLRLLIESGVARRAAAPEALLPRPSAAPRIGAAGNALGKFLTQTLSGLPEPFGLIPIWVLLVVGMVFAAGATGLVYASMQPRTDVHAFREPTTLSDVQPRSDAPPAASVDVAQLASSGAAAIAAWVSDKPGDAAAQLVAARAFVKAGDRVAAVKAVAASLQLEPRLSTDRYVAGVLWDTAQRSESADAAFELLKGTMATPGADILFDLASTPGVQPTVATRAKSSLRTKAYERVASPATRVAAELLLAPNCEARKGLLVRAGAVADGRALPLLESYLAGKGCAAEEGANCNACIKASPQLSRALNDIRERAARSGNLRVAPEPSPR